jgi:hypothetical protein
MGVIRRVGAVWIVWARHERSAANSFIVLYVLSWIRLAMNMLIMFRELYFLGLFFFHVSSLSAGKRMRGGDKEHKHFGVVIMELL